MLEPNKAKVAVSLVTYNAEKYLPFCLPAVLNQTCKDFEILIIDNGSTDRTVPFLKENFPQIKVVAHPKNLGFARAHNQAIAWTESEFVLLLNQDVVLSPDYLEKTVSYLEKQRQAATVSGKILIWDFLSNQKTKVIDSLGLKVFKSHRVTEIGEGEIDQGGHQEIKEVFGVSGPAALFRRSALEAVKIKLADGLTKEEYFDEDFFAYKEDVDLAFRLRLAGCQAFYLPEALAYHDRSVRGLKTLKKQAVRLHRQDREGLIKIYSYKNHLLLLLKNEFFANFLRYFWPTFWFELKKFIYILFFEPSTLRGLKMFFKQRRRIFKKRQYIIKNIRKIKPEELAKWYD